MFVRQILRRVLDEIVATALLALVAPLLAVVAALIKVFGGPGPVLIRQQRFSAGGTSFLAWQFRSARYRSLRDPSSLSHIEEAFLTPFGSWLHQCHLDELPTLVNVIAGDIGLLDIAHS